MAGGYTSNADNTAGRQSRGGPEPVAPPAPRRRVIFLPPLLLTVMLSMVLACGGGGIGDPCEDNTDCDDIDPYGICIDYFPHGYCTAPCFAAKSCPQGSKCIETNLLGDEIKGACFKKCTSDDDCRRHYKCDQLDKICLYEALVE